ncbi:MAG: YceI family protein [Chloroflexi bacterium]|nr:YceI family protein [Chloroflexota bacterium]
MTSSTRLMTASRWSLALERSSIEFAAKHMVFSTVHGQFGKFEIAVDLNEGRPERTNIEAMIDATSINTGESRRDGHLRSPAFLDVENYPHVAFRSTCIRPQGSGRYEVVGDLTIRSVTRQALFDALVESPRRDQLGNRCIAFTLKGSLNRKDFGLMWKAAVEKSGLVSNSISVSVKAEIVEQW